MLSYHRLSCIISTMSQLVIFHISVYCKRLSIRNRIVHKKSKTIKAIKYTSFSPLPPDAREIKSFRIRMSAIKPSLRHNTTLLYNVHTTEIRRSWQKFGWVGHKAPKCELTLCSILIYPDSFFSYRIIASTALCTCCRSQGRNFLQRNWTL